MRQLKYRRRQDSGVTRVWVGRQRARVLRELAGASVPLTAFQLAGLSGTSYPLANNLLEHLEAAGYVTCEKGLISSGGGRPDEWARYFKLSYMGDVQLAAFLAPRV